MRQLHEIAIFQTVKSKVVTSLFERVRLSVSISLRNLFNSLKSIKEIGIFSETSPAHCKLKHFPDIFVTNSETVAYVCISARCRYIPVT